MAIRYRTSVKCIKQILIVEYGMDKKSARQAIDSSPFATIFHKDPVEVTHTAYEVWAKEIFEYWKKTKKRDAGSSTEELLKNI